MPYGQPIAVDCELPIKGYSLCRAVWCLPFPCRPLERGRALASCFLAQTQRTVGEAKKPLLSAAGQIHPWPTRPWRLWAGALTDTAAAAPGQQAAGTLRPVRAAGAAELLIAVDVLLQPSVPCWDGQRSTATAEQTDCQITAAAALND